MSWRDADFCGAWAPEPYCRWHKESNFEVIEIKSVRIPFGMRAVARILRPLSDFFGFTNSGDTYDHHAIFVDLKCPECGKHTVRTVEFERNGVSKRYGYYRQRVKLNDSRRISSKHYYYTWGDMQKKVLSRFDNFGDYRLNGNNCQDYVAVVFPRLKAIPKRDRREEDSDSD